MGATGVLRALGAFVEREGAVGVDLLLEAGSGGLAGGGGALGAVRGAGPLDVRGDAGAEGALLGAEAATGGSARHD